MRIAPTRGPFAAGCRSLTARNFGLTFVQFVPCAVVHVQCEARRDAKRRIGLHSLPFLVHAPPRATHSEAGPTVRPNRGQTSKLMNGWFFAWPPAERRTPLTTHACHDSQGAHLASNQTLPAAGAAGATARSASCSLLLLGLGRAAAVVLLAQQVFERMY